LLSYELDGGDWSASRPGCFTPSQQPLLPTANVTGLQPQPVLFLWWREKSITHAGIL